MKLNKKNNRKTVEAYACKCTSCGCNTFCGCNCSIFTNSATQKDSALNMAYSLDYNVDATSANYSK